MKVQSLTVGRAMPNGACIVMACRKLQAEIGPIWCCPMYEKDRAVIATALNGGRS